MAYIIDHSFALSESFKPNPNYTKKTNKITTTKWATENATKSLTKHAVNQDRKRKYGFEFDNITDTHYEDYINEEFRRKTTRRLLRNKLKQHQKEAALIPYGEKTEEICEKHFNTLIRLIGNYVRA